MTRQAMTRRSSIPLLLAAAMLAGACTPAAAPGPTLEDRTFLSTNVEGRILVPGTTVRLTFERGQVGINAGCNSMGGSYAIDGGRLIVRDIHSTDMACDPPLMDQDRWVSDLLSTGAAGILAGETLTLEGSGVRLTLLDRRVVEPDRPLEGTRWVVEGMISGGTVSSIPPGVTAAIRIEDGRASVEAGCNSGGASVEIADGTATFGPLALTRIGCEPDRMEVERAISSVLTGRALYRIEADVLTLGTDASALILRAAP
jgi:heat shock protein HslJ